MKLTKPQKLLLSRMRTHIMKRYYHFSDYSEYRFINHSFTVKSPTANALFKIGIFTVDEHGYCYLTHLGKTIEL